MVGTAYALPFASCSVDAIYCEAVLEHLEHPELAVAEMHRVLRHGGQLFAATPFLQPYHGYPDHFQNFTLSGHVRLFERASFGITASGTCVGPAFALVDLLSNFLREFLPTRLSEPWRLLRDAAGRFTCLLVDRYLLRRPDSHMLASARSFTAARWNARRWPPEDRADKGTVVALVVLIRGINVGGHKTFRPKTLVESLKHLDPVNIGAAGTLVIRRSVPQAELRAEVARRLPFEAEIMICRGREVSELMSGGYFDGIPVQPDITRFVSLLAKRPRSAPPTPMSFPADGEWMLKVLAVENRFVVGVYRRQMKAIDYLGRLDRVFGVAADDAQLEHDDLDRQGAE